MLNVFRTYRGIPAKDRHDWALGSFFSERALRRALDIHDQLMQYLEVCDSCPSFVCAGDTSRSDVAGVAGNGSACPVLW